MKVINTSKQDVNLAMNGVFITIKPEGSFEVSESNYSKISKVFPMLVPEVKEIVIESEPVKFKAKEKKNVKNKK